MDTEGSAPPLPPPPLQSEPEAEPDWRLSWWTVLYGALAAVPKALASFASVGTVLTPGVGTGLAWWFPHNYGVLVPFAAGRVWAGALFAAGLVVADRLAPVTWPRRLRWAVGAALATLAPSPWYVVRWIQWRGSYAPSAALVLSEVLGLVTAAFMGWYVGRAVRAGVSPWRRLPWRALEASVIVAIVGECVGVGYSLTSPSGVVAAMHYMGASLANLWFAVAQAVVAGALLGLALAAGLKRGRTETAAISVKC